MKWVSPPPMVLAELTCRMRMAAVEIRKQFHPGHGGGSNFSYGDTGGMIRQNGRLFHGGAAGKRQSQRCNHGVARARDIEDFLRNGRDVKRLLPALAQEHSLIAERDEQQRIGYSVGPK